MLLKRGAGLFLMCLLLMASAAWAQDDPFGLSGYANGDSPPVVLQDNTAYEFAFDVFNFTGGEVSIQRFDITLPNAEYTLDEAALEAPQALHEDMLWQVDYHATSYTVTWESICTGTSNSAEVGDIREGEILQFRFTATTDSNTTKAATDGFLWKLTGDDNETVVSGLLEFGEGSTDDDDDNTTEDDDDDNENANCGC